MRFIRYFPVEEDKDPVKTYAEYRSRLSQGIDAYKSFTMKQFHYMWMRDRLWFVKNLIEDFGHAEAKKRLEALIDKKAEDIG